MLRLQEQPGRFANLQLASVWRQGARVESPTKNFRSSQCTVSAHNKDNVISLISQRESKASLIHSRFFGELFVELAESLSVVRKKAFEAIEGQRFVRLTIVLKGNKLVF